MPIRSSGARLALIAVVAIGVLSMHGLATAELESSAAPPPGVAALHSGATPDGHGGSHGDLGHIGIVCTWLLVTTGAAIAARGVAREWRIRRPTTTSALASAAATLRSPSARSPDPPVTAIAPLIC
jgi:hypothetical protein